MISHFSDALYHNLRRQQNDNLLGLWLATLDDEHNRPLPAEIATFSYRRDLFLWGLGRLLFEGKLRLAKNNILLDAPPNALVAQFTAAWPPSEEAADHEIGVHHGCGMLLWFFMEACPGSAVWVEADGTLTWVS